MVINRGIVLPVDVGLAGPASADKLLRYALRCGVGATLRADCFELNAEDSGFVVHP